MKTVQGQPGDFFAPPPERAKRKKTFRPVKEPRELPPTPWRSPAPAPRAEWVGPLQEIRTEVPAGYGWIIVSQEVREYSCRVWLTSAIHPKNHEWDGVLPFTSKDGVFAPCHRSYSELDRDRAIFYILGIFALPATGPKRDFTCSSCRLTERDGATNRPADKLCVFCRK